MSCACTILPDSDPFALPYYAGDTAPLRVDFFDADGAAYSLAGCSLAFVVYADDGAGAAALWQKGIGQGIAILDLVGGIVAIFPTAIEAALLVAKRTYPARLVLTDAMGSILTMATGYLQAL